MAKFLSDTKVAWDISPMAIFFRTIIVCFGTFCMFSWATYLCVFGLPVTIFLGNMFVWFWIFCRFLGNMFVYFLDILPVLFWGQYVFVCWNILSVAMLFWATCSCVFLYFPFGNVFGPVCYVFWDILPVAVIFCQRFCVFWDIWMWQCFRTTCLCVSPVAMFFRQHVCVFCLWQCFLGNVFVCCGIFCMWQCFLGRMFVCFACGNVF